MPDAFKKYLFLFLLLGAAALLWNGQGWVALAVLLLLFGWLGWETKLRGRFAFVAQRRCPERIAELGGDLQAVAVSRTAPWALLVQAGPTVTRFELNAGTADWSRNFEAGAMALLLRPDGCLLWADEQCLHLTDAQGRDQASLVFEPPLFRQSYSLLLSTDGKRAVLHTPWFIQAFDPDLKALGPRLRYEEVGHYLKYALLSSDGQRLYTAGALLLDEEEGGAGMEARWDAWDLTADAWVNAWKQSYESYNNSHLRSLSLSEDDSVLCAELWQEGYEYRLYRPDGSQIWKRAGVDPVLSPQGKLLLWESHFEGVVLTRLEDHQTVYARKFEEKVRLKALADDGSCLILAGRQLCILGPDGQQRWEAWFKTDPSALGLGPAGQMAVIRDSHAGSLHLPWPC